MALQILGQTWNISQKGEEIITENNTINDKATILNNALNSDLKEIGSPVLNKIQNKNNICQVVLQIQKITNISAPKANPNSQAAPRMLKLVLTDGDGYIQAIEITPIPTINPDKTAPGSKLLINSAKVSSGYLHLNSNNFSILGGKVPALHEKWELAKSVRNHARQNSSSDGPPAWVNFGCKVHADIQDKSFKSLENKNQDSKENSKFDLLRQDAIAEATSGAVKKVFGGGVKQPVQMPQPSPRYKKPNDSMNREKKGFKNKLSNTKEVEEKPQKPSERVSLFAFLEDKLPPNETSNEPETIKPVSNNYNPRYQQQSNQPNNRNRNIYQHTKPVFEEGYKKGPIPQKKEETQVEINGLSNNFGKMSLNSQFASRSLKQHLNLGPQKKNSVENSNVTWNVGDDCVAKYWEDGKFYNANITAITESTCVVKFKGYGNIEEVLKTDCLPVVKNETNKRPHTGPMEFRRSSRTYRRQ